MPQVIIANAEDDLRRQVHSILEKLVPDGLRGRRVLIKPNIFTAVPGDKGATTHPQVVNAIVRACREKGGQVLVGDNPAGMETNSMTTAKKCGIYDASDGHFVNLSEQVVEVPAGCRYTPTFFMSKVIFDVDFIINVPIFKTHVLTVLTGAIKNTFGYIAGANKAQMHLKAPTRKRFSELLIDVYSKRPPDLHILDALTVMEGNGPRNGPVRPLGKILASTDGVALDATMARMAGIDPAQLHHITLGTERGLGTFEEKEIQIEGTLALIPNFQLPGSLATSPQDQRELLQKLGSLNPYCIEDKCTECGDCATNCPPQAITLDPYPVIDVEKCICCYCCVELCPSGAMVVPSGKIDGVFEKIFG
ncbi:MAG: DUF362 domain-containing protein [Chloroflexi bacterium]|nr:DUF362 domain-containing protein [Chloroflexota bacterium]